MSTENIDPQTGTYRLDAELLDRLTKVRDTERHELFSWLAKQGEAVQIEAHRLAGYMVQTFFNNERNKPRSEQPPRDKINEVRFAHLILAITAMRFNERTLSRRGGAGATEDIVAHRVARIKALKKSRRAPEREKFRTQYFYIVESLRKQKMTWRDIELYMKANHRTHWGYSWIKKTFEILTAELVQAGVKGRE